MEPGDLQDLMSQLRRALSDYDALTFLLDGSFEAYGPDVAVAVAQARGAVQDVSAKLAAVTEALEKTPQYKRQVLAQRARVLR